MVALIPGDERGRLKALHTYAILDTPPEKQFDDITKLAARICGVPLAAITLVDEARQWFKSMIGLSVCETSRAIAFCDHTIRDHRLLVVEDVTKDPRFAHNPLVTGPPHICFYAGVPLITEKGFGIGAFCVMDTVPRRLSAEQLDTLEALARQVMKQLEAHRSVSSLQQMISERDASQQALEASQRFATATLDALSAHIAILDENGVILAVNAAWHKFACKNGGALQSASVGTNYLTVCDNAAGNHSAEAPRVAHGIRAIAEGKRNSFRLEYPCHSPNHRRWFVIRATRFPGDGPARVVVAHENVTARKRAELRVEHQSKHDALTGLANRVLFRERVQRCLQATATDRTRRFAVLFLDLDRFKLINDSLGHAVGDKLLVVVADALKKGVRGGRGTSRVADFSSIGRMGGDEFTILLDQLQHDDDAEKVAGRLIQHLSRPVVIDGHEVFITMSIGIVHGHPRYELADDLVRDADVAMYHAKQNGKSRYAVFDASMHDQALATLEMQNDLRNRAIAFELSPSLSA